MVGVAILGYGIVGSGVAEVLSKNSQKISQRATQDVEILHILDIRDFPDSPYKFTKDFADIETDPRVTVVVETIGGVRAALEFTRRALLAGKHVVTSNKELVAEHGAELLAIAKEKNINYLFEASVGGGIPIIRPISQCLAANELSEIYGILNGTTNYMLTRMIKAGISLDEALSEAKQRGYAEADPTDDIEGKDACRKICILSALAFGHQILPRCVPTEGISKIDSTDVKYAAGAGMVIKLLGRARLLDDGRVCAYVAPHLLHRDNPLSSVEDVYNGILVMGDAIGEVMFYGRGAGKLPTASAVVADIIDAVRSKTRKNINWDDGSEDAVAPVDSIPCVWYIRGNINAADAESAYGEVSILSIDGAPEGETAFVTGEIIGKPASIPGVKTMLRVL